MKYRWIGRGLALLLITGGLAAVTAQEQKAIDIDRQIQQIESAPPAQRYKLMNRFKIQLATMNRKERLHAIEILKRRMHGAKGHQIHEHRDEPKSYRSDHVNFHQHNQIMHQGINEKMGQKQGVEESIHRDSKIDFNEKGIAKGVKDSDMKVPGSQIPKRPPHDDFQGGEKKGGEPPSTHINGGHGDKGVTLKVQTPILR